MRKTKFQRIKEQQKKARNKEIIWRVKKIFKYDNEEVTKDLEYIVTQLHIFGKMGINEIKKLLPRGYQIIEENENEI